MKLMQTFLLAPLLLMPALAAAQTVAPISARGIFVPAGFSDTNVSEVVVDGYLPNGCYKVSDGKVAIDQAAKVITVTQEAHLFTGRCPMISVPYWNTIELGVLPVGQYTINVVSGPADKLQVKTAPLGGTLPGGDEQLYEPIDAISVAYSDADHAYAVNLQGRFTSTCQTLDHIDVQDQGKVQVILPIMKMAPQTDCDTKEIAFNQRVLLPKDMTAGRHLVHVRSLTGHSVNDVFSVN